MGELSNEPRKRGRPRKNPLPTPAPEAPAVEAEGVTQAAQDNAPVPAGSVVEPEAAAPVGLSDAQAKALDRDHDGEPGGSWPHASLTEPQKAAWVQEAIDAHESQTELKRVDAFNRVWTFRHEVVKNHLHLMIHCKRGPKEAQRLLSVAWMPRDMIEGVINELDAEMAR